MFCTRLCHTEAEVSDTQAKISEYSCINCHNSYEHCCGGKERTTKIVKYKVMGNYGQARDAGRGRIHVARQRQNTRNRQRVETEQHYGTWEAKNSKERGRSQCHTKAEVRSVVPDHQIALHQALPLHQSFPAPVLAAAVPDLPLSR